jgi:hypothetical protein
MTNEESGIDNESFENFHETIAPLVPSHHYTTLHDTTRHYTSCVNSSLPCSM